MIVNKALARSHNSLGNDLDRFVAQMSLATFPFRLTIMSITLYGIV